MCVRARFRVCCVRDRLHPSVFIVYCTPGGARARENRSLKNTLFWGMAKFCGFLIANAIRAWSVCRRREGVEGSVIQLKFHVWHWEHVGAPVCLSPALSWKKEKRKKDCERQRVTTMDKRPCAKIKQKVSVVGFPSSHANRFSKIAL